MTKVILGFHEDHCIKILYLVKSLVHTSPLQFSGHFSLHLQAIWFWKGHLQKNSYLTNRWYSARTHLWSVLQRVWGIFLQMWGLSPVFKLYLLEVPIFNNGKISLFWFIAFFDTSKKEHVFNILKTLQYLKYGLKPLLLFHILGKHQANTTDTIYLWLVAVSKSLIQPQIEKPPLFPTHGCLHLFALLFPSLTSGI